MASVERTRSAIAAIAERVAGDADRLRALDAEVGDGDLGVTVTSGCQAVRAALADDASQTHGELFALVGRSFAAANPSTMANLLGIALRRVVRHVGEATDVQPSAWTDLLAVAIDGIAERGGAVLGDKTILDALHGSHARLAELPPTSSPAALAAAARSGAEDAAAAITPLPARAGRAAWQAERTRGTPDPGAELWVATARAIEAVAV